MSPVAADAARLATAALRSRGPSSHLDETDQNPFPGPRPYRRGQDLFYGRSRQIEELTSLVLSTQTVLISAPSGFGKSSLVEAGLLPAVQGIGVHVPTTVRLARPTAKPKNNNKQNPFLQLACDALRLSPNETKDTRDDLRQLIRSLREDVGARPILIVLDQFEELFLDEALWQERHDFLVTLRTALDADDLLHVLLIMRSDYLEDFIPYEKSLQSWTFLHYIVDQIDGPGAREVIEHAFNESGVELATQQIDRLVEALLRIPGDPSGKIVQGRFVNLVQLQIVCRRLWYQRVEDQASVQAEASVPADTALDVEVSMQNFVTDAIDEVVADTGVDEGVLRRWIEDRLIRGGRRTLYVLDTRDADLPKSVIDALEKARLIQLEQRHRSRLAELTHDSVVKALQDSNIRWMRRHRRRVLLTTAASLTVLVLLLGEFLLLRQPLTDPLLASVSSRVVSGSDAALITFRPRASQSVVAAIISVESSSSSSGDETSVGARLISADIVSIKADGTAGAPVLSSSATNDADSAQMTLTGQVIPGREFAVRVRPTTAEGYVLFSATVQGLVPDAPSQGRIGDVPIELNPERDYAVFGVPSAGVYVARGVGSGTSYGVRTLASGNDAMAFRTLEKTWVSLYVGTRSTVRVMRLRGDKGPSLDGTSTFDSSSSYLTLDAPLDRRTARLAAVCPGRFSLSVVDVDGRLVSTAVSSEAPTGGPARNVVDVAFRPGSSLAALVLPDGAEGAGRCTAQLTSAEGGEIRLVGSQQLGIQEGKKSTSYDLRLPGSAVVVVSGGRNLATKLECKGTVQQGRSGGQFAAYIPKDGACVLVLERTTPDVESYISAPSTLTLVPEIGGGS